MNIKRSLLIGLMMLAQLNVKSAPRVDTVTVINAGINGNNSADLLARLNKDVLRKSPQLVVMMIGTNDMLNERNMLSLKAYEKNYQELIARIEKKATLILMTIPPVNSAYIIERKPGLKFSINEPQKRVDSANIIIKRLAEKNKCVLIDPNKIFTACGGSNTNKDCLFQNEANSGFDDGVHPNYNGYRVMAAAIYQTIRMSYPEVKRIVCFGDSITYGYRMKGGGTIEGQCYPAILNRMFNQ
jgi:lysophospholipase L1-like esterase